MDIHQIDVTQNNGKSVSQRPDSFQDFIGQQRCTQVLKAAVTSARTKKKSLEHILLSGQSGYGKTTLAQIVAMSMQSNIKVITGYAIQKPADMVSLLNSLGENDILFIDEIHRLRSTVEEVLYIAMEDYRIDMVMPDGGSISIPLHPFTLIGATTQLEKLSTPLKNRFVYKFHFEEYTETERQLIIARYLHVQAITYDNKKILEHVSAYIPTTPREIANTCVQLKDYLIAHNASKLHITTSLRDTFRTWSSREKGGITSLHKKYLTILSDSPDQAIGLKTLSVKLGMSEQSVEDDIEPLLFKLGKIEKTSRGRILVG